MPTAREDSAPARVSHELEDRLAVTVFEILPAQAASVHPQKQVTTRSGYERNLLSGISTARPTASGRNRASSFWLVSGTHMTVSPLSPLTPPSQLPARPRQCLSETGPSQTR